MQLSEFMSVFYKNRAIFVPVGLSFVFLLMVLDIYYQSSPLRAVYNLSQSEQVKPAPTVTLTQDNITEWPLFGVNEQGLGIAASLPWQLIGILDSSTPNFGSVIVESQKVQTQVSLGEKLPDGSILQSISPTQIVVKKAGKSFVVPLQLDVFTPSSPMGAAPAGPGDDINQDNYRKLWDNQGNK